MADADPSKPRPRTPGPPLALGLAAIVLCAAGWFALMAGLALGLMAATMGWDAAVDAGWRALAMAPRALARSDPAAQRAFFGLGCAIYLAGTLGILSALALWGRHALDMLAWRGPWPAMTPLAWKLFALAPLYHVVAGLTLKAIYPDFSLWLMAPRDPLALALSFLMIVVLAPLVEELLFRGFIYARLRARLRAGSAVAVTTVVFALAHWDGLGLYPAAVLAPGLVLTLIRERTGSTKAAALGHGLYNLAGWALLLAASALFGA